MRSAAPSLGVAGGGWPGALLCTLPGAVYRTANLAGFAVMQAEQAHDPVWAGHRQRGFVRVPGSQQAAGCMHDAD